METELPFCYQKGSSKFILQGCQASHFNKHKIQLNQQLTPEVL